MTSALLLVPLTFLTIIGLSNFCSLNPYFAAIFQSINISIALLSRSTFTVTPLCISTFSIPMSIYTSLSILNVLFTFFAVPSAYASLCCAFPFVGHTASSSFTLGIYTTQLSLTSFLWGLLVLCCFSCAFLSFHTIYILCRLLWLLLSSILTPIAVHLLAHSPLHSIPAPFPNWDVPASLLAVPFADWLYMPLSYFSFLSPS